MLRSRALTGLFILLVSWTASAQQSDVRIPLNETLSAPAIDLIHPQTKESLDRDWIIDYLQKGGSTETFEPQISNLYLGQEQGGLGFPDLPYPQELEILTFQQELAHASGLFRARVISEKHPETHFQILFSLDSHAALARNALLRKLGYNIPSPKYYPSLTVQFSSLEQRDQFLDHLSDETLTARSRWVKGGTDTLDKKELTLTFQDVCLEPGIITVPQFHWGILTESAIQSRRSIRALILPLALLDLPESVNMYSFEFAKIFSENLVLSRPNANRFQNETSIGDIYWIAQKIAKLTRADWTQIIKLGKYPADIEALIIEKTLARVNQLMRLLKVKNFTKHKFNPYLTYGQVLNGKATQENYEGYAIRFAYGDPLSPLRPSEISRFLGMEVINAAFKLALSEGNKFLQAIKPEKYVSQHRQKLQQLISDHVQSNPGKPFIQPIEVWGGPTVGFNIGASRNLMTGTYYGSESQVQLVDTFSVSANVGGFVAVSGIPYIGLSTTPRIQVQRTYVHVKPIADLKSGLRENWLNLAVPHFMLKLSKLLTDPEEKPEAFLEELKPGEMIIINDAIIGGDTTKVNIPLGLLLGMGGILGKIEVSPSVNLQQTLLSRTTIYRDQDGFHVYLGKMRAGVFEGQLDTSFFIRLFTFAGSKNWGKAHTDAYVLPETFETKEQESAFKRAIRSLLRRNNTDVLSEEFSPYDLQHQAKGKRLLFSMGPFSWLKRETLHKLEITPPESEKVPNPEAFTRTVMEGTLTKIRGTDVFGFFGDLLRSIIPYIDIGNGGQGDDPSANFLGKSRTFTASSEMEITEGRPNLFTSTLRESYNGWSMKQKKLIKLIHKLEEKIGPSAGDLIDETEFTQTKKIQAYSVMWNLILYEEGLQKIIDILDREKTPTKAAINKLVSLMGIENFKAWCKEQNLSAQYMVGPIALDSPQSSSFIGESNRGQMVALGCSTPWMRTVFKFRSKLNRRSELFSAEIRDEKIAQSKIKWMNRFFADIESEIPLEFLIAWAGPENSFFQARVSGFRTHDENGDSQYFSNTIGKANSRVVTGPMSTIQSHSKIIEHELSARYLSSGF